MVCLNYVNLVYCLSVAFKKMFGAVEFRSVIRFLLLRKIEKKELFASFKKLMEKKPLPRPPFTTGLGNLHLAEQVSLTARDVGDQWKLVKKKSKN